jgi:hypothetical protein
MSHEYVNLTFKVYWQLKEFPHIKITRSKKLIDCKKSKLLSYSPRGYFISGNYYKRKDLNAMAEPIKDDPLGF